jgi:hypothetical protein
VVKLLFSQLTVNATGIDGLCLLNAHGTDKKTQLSAGRALADAVRVAEISGRCCWPESDGAAKGWSRGLGCYVQQALLALLDMG